MLVAVVLQAAALLVVALALLGVTWLDPGGRPRVLVLVDRSASVPRDASDGSLARLLRELTSTRAADVEVLEFAGKVSVASTRTNASAAQLDPAATNVETALNAALALHARTPLDGIVVISDGMENAGDARRALLAARDARLPLRWIRVSRPPPDAYIAEVLAPDAASVGQTIRASVQLAGRLDVPLRVRVRAVASEGDQQQMIGEPDAAGRVSVAFDARRSGLVVIDADVEDAASGRRLDALANAAAVDVRPDGQILYVQGSPGPLARSLQDGGWPLEVVAATRVDALADGLGSYHAVILDDVAVGDASAHFWSALASAVRDRGVGLMVLGGERSFGRGGYRGSDLESVLPVVAEPAALGQPLSVAFVVDKSGSMGEGTGGVDRFRLSQRAVLETARDLGERDSLSLIVFDVDARTLIPLGPARERMAVLARDWPVTPYGGTKIAPALTAAIDELERSAASRRALVLVTDGFIDNAPSAEMRARIDRAHIETIALGVGPDADMEALQRLAGRDGVALHVHEAAELALAMRSTIERRRARIERGTIGVRQTAPLPFIPGNFEHWQPVSAYAVVRSRPSASAILQSERGDPLIALQTSGQGRVVAVTCGLGRWTSRWASGPQWPTLAGGLTNWISGAHDDGRLGLHVAELPLALQLDADMGGAHGWSANEGVSLTMIAPSGEASVVNADYIAAGRMRAKLRDRGAGPYTFVMSTPLGTRRLVHMRSGRSESETWGESPALDVWKSDGLIDDWKPRAFASSRHSTSTDRHPDRSLVALGLALFLAGVVVDRAVFGRTRSRSSATSDDRSNDR